MKTFFILMILFTNQAHAANWTLESGRLSYTAKHPLKTTHGKSEAIKGKAVCDKGNCDFLIGVPVNTFKSGDTNRDLHMIQVTKGATFPVITAKTKMSEKGFLTNGSIKTDFEVGFGGLTVKVAGVQVQVDAVDGGARKVSGVFPLSLKSFSMVSPSLLGMSIEDQIPVEFTAIWKK